MHSVKENTVKEPNKSLIHCFLASNYLYFHKKSCVTCTSKLLAQDLFSISYFNNPRRKEGHGVNRVEAILISEVVLKIISGLVKLLCNSMIP